MILQPGKETILVIPDLQLPFEHPDAFAFLTHLKEKYNPTKVIGIGDSIDFHAVSDYVSDCNGYSAGEEYRRALDKLHKLYDIFPSVTEVESNHNVRIFKRAFGAGIPSVFLKSYAEFMEAPKGWKFVRNTTVDGIKFEHGDRFQGIYAVKKATEANMRSTVCGHHHTTAAIYYLANEEKMLFGMNVGCLIDQDAYAFAYSKHNKHRATLSAGIVDKGVPILEPMILDRRNRWIKR